MGSKIIKKKLWFSFKKQKVIPGKVPDIATQLDFIEDYKVSLKDAQDSKIHILFYDPVHQLHNSEAGKCWIEKWTEVFLKSNTWRKRITAMWGINPINLRFSGLIIEDNCDTETTKAALEIIREDYPDGKPIFIFLDNAAYNRSYEVQNHALTLWITLSYLPPYSPNLNLIERLRKFMKIKLVKNKYYETLDEFRSVFLSFFSNLWNYFDELQKIFDNKFQILKAV